MQALRAPRRTPIPCKIFHISQPAFAKLVRQAQNVGVCFQCLGTPIRSGQHDFTIHSKQLAIESEGQSVPFFDTVSNFPSAECVFLTHWTAQNVLRLCFLVLLGYPLQVQVQEVLRHVPKVEVHEVRVFEVKGGARENVVGHQSSRLLGDTVLGVDSPLFSTIVLVKNRLFP